MDPKTISNKDSAQDLLYKINFLEDSNYGKKEDIKETISDFLTMASNGLLSYMIPTLKLFKVCFFTKGFTIYIFSIIQMRVSGDQCIGGMQQARI